MAIDMEALTQKVLLDRSDLIAGFTEMTNQFKAFNAVASGALADAGSAFDKELASAKALGRQYEELIKLRQQMSASAKLIPGMSEIGGPLFSSISGSNRMLAGMGVSGRAQAESEARALGALYTKNIIEGMSSTGRPVLDKILGSNAMLAGMSAAGGPSGVFGSAAATRAGTPFEIASIFGLKSPRQQAEAEAKALGALYTKNMIEGMSGEGKPVLDKILGSNRLIAGMSAAGLAQRESQFGSMPPRTSSLAAFSTSSTDHPIMSYLQRAKTNLMDFARESKEIVNSIPGMGLLRAGIGAVGMVGGFVADTVGTIFNVHSLPGLILTVTGVTTVLWAAKAAFDVVSNAIHNMVSSGMEIERMQVTFGVLLGSVEAGKKAFSDIQALSIVTPYTASQLASTAQTLLGMGVHSDALQATLRRLGDVASGDADRLRRLAFAYGEVTEEGRLSGQRMRQFATLGIGIEDFAKTMGVSGPTFRSMLRNNMVDANVVADTINRLTSTGERFDHMSTAALNTVSGQWSRLGGVIEMTGGKMAMTLFQHTGVMEGLRDIGTWIISMTPSMITFAERVGDVLGAVLKDMRNVFGGMGEAGMKMSGNSAVQNLVGNLFSGLRDNASTAIDVFLNVADMLGTAASYLMKFTGFLAENVPAFLQEISGGLADIVEWLPGGGKKGVAGSVSSVTPEQLAFMKKQYSGQNGWARFEDVFEDLGGGQLRNKGSAGTGLAGILSRLADPSRLTGYNAAISPFAELTSHMPAIFAQFMTDTRAGTAARRAVGGAGAGEGMNFGPGGLIPTNPFLLSHDAQVELDKLNKQIGILGISGGTGVTVLDKFNNQMKALNEAYYGSPKAQEALGRMATGGGLIGAMAPAFQLLLHDTGFAMMQQNARYARNRGSDRDIAYNQGERLLDLGDMLRGPGNFIGGAFGAILPLIMGGKVPAGELGGAGFQLGRFEKFNDLIKATQQATSGYGLPKTAVAYTSEAQDAVNQARVDQKTQGEKMIDALVTANALQKDHADAIKETNRILTENPKLQELIDLLQPKGVK